MKIRRIIQREVLERLKEGGKVIVVYGARQVGKTTLVKEVLKELQMRILSVDADEERHVAALSSRNLDALRSFVAGYDVLFVDEAQRIENIGINLKILVDHVPGLRIIVTGSSSLDLASTINEPLTGRKWTYTLFPISVEELAPHVGNSFELREQTDERLIHGSYPALFSIASRREKEQYLQDISKSSLYKDILALANVKYPLKLRHLLELLAYQIGSQVSLSELAGPLDMGKDAIQRYIDLLEQSFIIFRLGGFSRNLRKEITKMNKIYFYDLGIRNAIIGNFHDIGHRSDIGQLWENFLMVERMKRHAYNHIYGNRYFWRTHTGSELDLVEERDGKLFGFEFAWKKKKTRMPKTWLETYDRASYECITRENYLTFVQ